jgi:hypothetical protein
MNPFTTFITFCLDCTNSLLRRYHDSGDSAFAFYFLVFLLPTRLTLLCGEDGTAHWGYGRLAWKIAFTGGKGRQLLVAALRSWLGMECGLNAKNACWGLEKNGMRPE